MAYEYLDLENKLYIPTQKLLDQIQLDLAGLFTMIRQGAIDAHNSLAVLGREWYDDPIATSERWYNQAVAYGADLYAVFLKNGCLRPSKAMIRCCLPRQS
nr:hypothetical protein [Methylomarinum sp. Ch1-1]MDP4522619.1 hypothetical protein [Methylomarinum sp. Ch1-1]